MFYSTADKVKLVFQTLLATLLAALAVFLSTYDFNAWESFNRFVESNNFFAQPLGLFIGGKIDNNFFFRNLGLASAIIATCYVGYLAYKFREDYKTLPGVLLSILFVVGILGLFALKTYYQITVLAADRFEFNGQTALWCFETVNTTIIVISAIVDCFRNGLGLYVLFVPAYVLGLALLIVMPIGFVACIILCVVAGREYDGGYSGSYSGSYASSAGSGKSSGSRTYKRKNNDDDYEELTDIKWTTPLKGWDDDDYGSSVRTRNYYDGDGNSLGYSVGDRYYDSDGSCVGYDVGDRHYDSDGNSTGYRVGDTEYDSDGNSVGYWIDDTFYEN